MGFISTTSFRDSITLLYFEQDVDGINLSCDIPWARQSITGKMRTDSKESQQGEGERHINMKRCEEEGETPQRGEEREDWGY